MSSLFSQAALFSKNCYFIVESLKKLTKNILSDCIGVVSHFEKKNTNFQSGQNTLKIGQKCILLLNLAKSLDKHGTTLVHVTYPPLLFPLPTRVGNS